ncbi:hypothetical protein GCM10027610_131790 [Dactylosporangium cerinum]
MSFAGRLIPESADSTGNGTLTRSGRVWPKTGLSLVVDWRSCHSPLRLSQSGRVICGRGYSGSGWPASAWLVQGVVSGDGWAGAADAGGAADTAVPRLSTAASAAPSSRRRWGVADMGVLLGSCWRAGHR